MSNELILNKYFANQSADTPFSKSAPEKDYAWFFGSSYEEDRRENAGRTQRYIESSRYTTHTTNIPEDERSEYYMRVVRKKPSAVTEQHFLFAGFDRGVWKLYEDMRAEVHMQGSSLSHTADVSRHQADFDNIRDLLIAMREWEYKVISIARENDPHQIMRTSEKEISEQFGNTDHWFRVAGRHGILLPALQGQLTAHNQNQPSRKLEIGT